LILEIKKNLMILLAKLYPRESNQKIIK